MVVVLVWWYLWPNISKMSVTGCLQKFSFNWDCGGATPSYDCPHLERINWDDGERCNTGRDCCSSKCMIKEGGNICTTYTICNGDYIDIDGNKQAGGRCFRNLQQE